MPVFIYDIFKESYSQNEAVVIYSSGTTDKSKEIILSHSSALTGELPVALKTRIKLVIVPVVVHPKFVLNNIEKYNVSIIGVNPTLLNMYAEEVSRNVYILTSLKTIYVSGSILNDKVYNKVHDVFMNVKIYNVYGLSEAGPRLTVQREWCCKENSVEKPIKGAEVVIVNAYKVYPCDAERLILENPLISDCAVSRCRLRGLEIIGCLYCL